MDGNEAKLLDRYEAQFGETPPIAFLDPQTSKRLMMDAIRNNRPFNEKDLESDPDGMVRKHQLGELRLERSLWALREAKWGKAKRHGVN
jgi:hypothetical protein